MKRRADTSARDRQPAEDAVQLLAGELRELRREFAGSSAAGPESMPAAAGAEALPGGAPTFADQLSPADWETWCKAFAAVPT